MKETPRETAQPVLRALVWCGFAAAVLVLLAGWNQPLLDVHGFRQTQTAISAYWMTRGGDWWAYQTPVLGAPWVIPFEFPLYQWLVALLAGSPLPLSVDQAGRVVTLACQLATLWPLRAVLRRFGANADLVALATVFFLFSPLHLFWGRTVMIESLALLLAVAYVAAMQRLVGERQWRWLLPTIVLATLAALVKITTFVGFAVLAGGLVAAALWLDARERQWRRAAWLAIAAATGIVVALAALKGYLHFADAYKRASPMAATLASDSLARFNFGSLPQRLSAEFWQGQMLGRMLPQIAGAAWLAVPLLLVPALLWARRWGLAALAAAALFLVPPMVFTNLHFLHQYYPMANATFFLVALACVVHATGARGPRWLPPVLAVACVGAMLWQFQGGYWRDLREDKSGVSTMTLAHYLRANTAPDDVLLIRGLRWSSELAYYAERRALMSFRKDLVVPTPAMRVTPEHPEGAPVGAIVLCRDRAADPLSPLLGLMGERRRIARVAGCVVVLRG